MASDSMTVGALRALHYAGIRVPQDMALVSIGDPACAPHMVPALTTLAHPLTEAGEIAARFLLEQVAASEPLQTLRLSLSFDLRVRESCGSQPVLPEALL